MSVVAEVRQTVTELAGAYPAPVRSMFHANIDRYAFELSLIRKYAPAGSRLLDVGGGLSGLSVLCALSGYDVILVDDFADSTYREVAEPALLVHMRHGVKIRRKDILQESLFERDESFSIITLIDVIEHLSRSPRVLLHSCIKQLRPNGALIIGAPNCVNLRKRITVPLGYGKWTSMSSWYDEPIFRSHVREPDVDDLRYIAVDLKLKQPQVIGRNFGGLMSANPLISKATRLVDRVLRLKPSLCSNLYLAGTV